MPVSQFILVPLRKKKNIRPESLNQTNVIVGSTPADDNKQVHLCLLSQKKLEVALNITESNSFRLAVSFIKNNLAI